MYLSGCTLSPLQWSPWAAICLFQSQCCGQKVWTPPCGFPSEWAFIFYLFMVLVSLHSSRVVLNCGGVKCSIRWMRLKNIVWGKNTSFISQLQVSLFLRAFLYVRFTLLVIPWDLTEVTVHFCFKIVRSCFRWLPSGEAAPLNEQVLRGPSPYLIPISCWARCTLLQFQAYPHHVFCVYSEKLTKEKA